MFHSNFDEARAKLINLFFFFFEKTYELEYSLSKENISGEKLLFFIEKIINQSVSLFGKSLYSSKEFSFNNFLQLIDSNINLYCALGFENQITPVYSNWTKIINYDNYQIYDFQDTLKTNLTELIKLTLDIYSYSNFNTNLLYDFPINIEIYPSNSTYLSSIKSKHPKEATINIYLSNSNLDFYDFMNIPFYVFHELTSHIFSTVLFADLLEKRKNQAHGIFEDGWMLYCEYDYYWNYINKSNENSWLRSQTLDLYINKIFNLSNVIYNGFQTAKWFHNEILKFNQEKLWAITCDLALTSYCCLGSNDFHSEFVNNIEMINRRKLGEKLKKILDEYSSPEDFGKKVYGL